MQSVPGVDFFHPSLHQQRGLVPEDGGCLVAFVC